MKCWWLIGCAFVSLIVLEVLSAVIPFDANKNSAFSDDQINSDCLTYSSDSLTITCLLSKVDTLSTKQNKILFLAKGFLGTPYKGGTLETFPFEHLVVRTDSVDCTTFVEYVLALYVVDQHRMKHSTQKEKLKHVHQSSLFANFKDALQMIRYRGGRLSGYTSRLHYFSDWIFDNEQKGLVKEVTKDSPYAIRRVNLNFMSLHASLYPFLANDTAEITKMKQVESCWTGYNMPYVPKEKLGEGRDVLQINDGDILTLVTNIKGLDVVHVGFACWINGKLHLLHASSSKKRVILDPVPLFKYSQHKKSHIGVRVIRVLN